MEGKIVKGIAGFYEVHVEGRGVYTCKARGIFRKERQKPLVGDDVLLECLSEEEREGSITELLPRRSELLRPAVANIDQALVIFAAARPEPSLNLLDRFLVMMRSQKLPCVICFNKCDLIAEERRTALRDVYEKSGCPVLFVSALTGEGLAGLRETLRNRTTSVAGPSGAGKSSLINALQSHTRMETGAISEKTERGRHTTRHTELVFLWENTYIMDTPGFSSLQIPEMEKEGLKDCYPDFAPFAPHCRFPGCVHVREPDCAVKAALRAGQLSPERYENYLLLYEELKSRKRY